MREPVLVLGASGFIGRRLAEMLAAAGEHVIAASRRVVAYEHANIEAVVDAFDSCEQFLPLVARSRVVVHVASSSTPGSSDARPQLDGNLRPTLALIEALQAHRNCRLIYVSSGGTLYGECDHAAVETDLLRPRSYHGAGKAAAEHFIGAWAAQYAGSAVVLRPSNVYGPGQHPRSGFGIVSAAFAGAINRSPVTVWGDGQSTRDYLYIDDFLDLLGAVVGVQAVPGVHTFNASSGNVVPLTVLLDLIDATTGTPLSRRYEPFRKVDVSSVKLANVLARSTFGWNPSTRLEQGLRKTWEWVRENA